MRRFDESYAQLEALEVLVQKMRSSPDRDRLLLELAELRSRLDRIRSGRLTSGEVKEGAFAAMELIRFVLLFLGH